MTSTNYVLNNAWVSSMHILQETIHHKQVARWRSGQVLYSRMRSCILQGLQLTGLQYVK